MASQCRLVFDPGGAGPCPARCVMSRWSQTADETDGWLRAGKVLHLVPGRPWRCPTTPQVSILIRLSDFGMESCGGLSTRPERAPIGNRRAQVTARPTEQNDPIP